MSFFSNPEIRRDGLIWLLLFLILVPAGFLVGLPAGLLILLCLLLTCGWHFTVTYRRYRRIRSLSRDLDALLHGAPHIEFDSYREGELAILQNELEKMTRYLREQADALLQDKLLLTDSIADISHQLKTPLTSINLILSRLESPETDPEQKRLLYKELERLVTRIDRLVSSLLKLSRLDAGTIVFKKERLPLSELIRRSAEPLLIPMEVKDLRFVTEAEPDASCTADPFWTTEALGNILKNCMEHTPVGGTIRVTGRENALYAEITVSDTGTGIRPEDLPHLFERFYKGADASPQSVGIGLALSRMILVGQNGTVKAENRESGGARFLIRFYKSTI